MPIGTTLKPNYGGPYDPTRDLGALLKSSSKAGLP